MTTAIVTGAGGFIGSHLVKHLKAAGYFVYGIDVKPPEFEPTHADHFLIFDLRQPLDGFTYPPIDEVYALAADMGGMGFITTHDAEISYNNAMINLNTIEFARQNGVKRFFYTSSACVYPKHLQTTTDVKPLVEEDAIPAEPEDAYGWEKLYTEQVCRYYKKDHGLETRVVRFHNIYGPRGTWTGGREKSPAALCRKVAEAKMRGLDHIEVWGDGEQTRSYCYIDDCVEGIRRLMRSGYHHPLNLGTDRLITINDLAKLIMRIANYECSIEHVSGPQGVRGRNSDNTRIREVLSWEPKITLEDGLTHTYYWIEQQWLQTNGVTLR